MNKQLEAVAKKEYPIKIESIMEGSHDVNSYERNAFIKGATHVQETELKEARELIEELKNLLQQIDNTLFHYNLKVDGYHLNGELEPMMNFVADFDMDLITKAENFLNK